MRVMQVARARDDQLLNWLRARSRGGSVYAMGKLLGINSGIIITALNNVLAADLAESGEPPDLVRAKYWTPKSSKAQPSKAQPSKAGVRHV